MDWIGKIADFITVYPEIASGILIGICSLAAVILIVCFAANSRKKKRMISDIRDKVTEINAKISGFGQSKPDVIYIDNRTGEAQKQKSPVDLPEDAPLQEKGAPCESEKKEDWKATEANDREELSADGEESGGRAVQMNKYFSRDCAVSKNGRAYTEEELIKQIKE